LKIKLIYLNIPFWRAEIGRIALYIGNIDFEDVRISRDEFLRSRKTGELDDGTVIPFRQIPCLNIDGKSINQTGGISRFCGKISGLYPIENAVDAALIDQIIDMATDITVLLGPSLKEKNEETKKIMREKLARGALVRKISYLEELLEEGKRDWFVNQKISIADLAIWRLIGWLTSGMIDYLPSDLVAPFPNLKRIFLNVERHPKVIEWIKMTYPEDYIFSDID
jgi:prostaglandin-H2 D-isomerase / glutathione transferase